MPLSPSKLNDPSIAGPLGTLALSTVTPRTATASLRARAWQRDLDKLGVTLPFGLIHDLGLLFALPRAQLEIAPRCDFSSVMGRAPGATGLAASYAEVVTGIAESDAARRAGELKMGDALIVAVLGRLLGSVAKRTNLPRKYEVALPADASIFELSPSELTSLWASTDRQFELAAAAALVRARLLVLTLADGIDAETLRLFGVLGDPSQKTSLAQIDLIRALETPGARDVVSFSLELLPSVLETRVRPSASTHAASGYAGIGRRGSLDGMVLTELAWDDDELLRRIADDEVLYYARDQAEEPTVRMHLLLIDASASMRGDRATFARGLALATAKKLSLSGEEVAFRFFDSRLYELARVRGREMPTSYVLSFKGERGRNPSRVFATLAHEIAILRSREKREVVVHLFTHGASDIPRPILQQLRAEARLVAVFIAPRGEASPDYIDLCDAHWTVTREEVMQHGVRGDAARSILSETKQ